MGEPEFYHPVPRGLEIQIGEKLNWIRAGRRAALKMSEPL
jgi:putative ATPase